MSSASGKRSRECDECGEPVAKKAATSGSRESAPFGSWASLITAEDIAASTVSLKTTSYVAGTRYWLESRPSEEGRYVVVKEGNDGKHVDVLPSPWSARSIVYNYGGGPYAVANDGTVYFCNYRPATDKDPIADYRIYRLKPSDTTPTPLTTSEDMRYGNLVWDEANQQIWAVRENWNGVFDPVLPNTTIVRISTTGEETVEFQNSDLYFCGQASPDGSQFAFIGWKYPNMPWDGTSLYVADLQHGAVTQVRYVTGGTGTSIMQPQWGPENKLYYLSDSTGRWNFKRVTLTPECMSFETITSLTDAEFGAPEWGMDNHMYAFDVESQNIVAARCTKGVFSLVKVNTTAPFDITELDIKDDNGHAYSALSAVAGGVDQVVLIAGNNWTPSRVISYTLSTATIKTLRKSTTLKPGMSEYISTAEAIEFPTTDGAIAYGFYYPPTNPKYSGSSGEKPPLILRSHGGPSAAASTVLDLNIHYFTSRGLALVDVNYRGSSGYGREFLTSLYGYWGVKDPQDCLAAADYLEKRGDIDGKRLVAEGGSAGGYCTNVLATYYNRLAAGASFYGISNLLQLAKMTGNYERHYIDQLVGPLPQSTKLYMERSPLFHVQDPKVKLTTPVVFFQGTDDHVVPPEQTKAIFETLVKKGVPTSEKLFPGEQHGFRIAADIEASLWGEEYFLSQMLKYTPADKDLKSKADLTIENWPQK